MHLFKLTVNVPSYFTARNYKNENYIVWNAFELTILESRSLSSLKSLEYPSILEILALQAL